MSEEKIGGLSLEEIMAAAMDDLNDDDTDSKEPVFVDGGIVMKECSGCGIKVAVNGSRKKCPECNNYFFGEIDDNGKLVEKPMIAPGARIIPVDPVDIKSDISKDVKTPADPDVIKSDIGGDVKVSVDPIVVKSDIGGDINTPAEPIVFKPDIDNSSSDSEKTTALVKNKKKDLPAPINDDTYTIGSVRLVNVTNRLSAEYENMVYDIMSYIDADRTAEALQLAQQLIDNNMSSEVAWLIHAYAKEAWGDDALALKSYQQSIAINPRFALALNDIGAFFHKTKDGEKARFYFEKALENDPDNILYKGNVAYILCFTESYEAAIEKCKYFIDVSDEKTYLQNMLGRIYVELSKEYVVDVPNALNDPSQGTSPGFISLEDIEEVRKLCNNAKSLLTLDEFSEDNDMAEVLLQLCDEDCQLSPCHQKKWIVILHAIIVCIIYSLCTLIWGFPIALAVAIITVKADYFPGYVYNYVWYTGSDDPLKYSRDSFYKNHDLLKSMADGAKDGWNSTPSQSDSFWGEMASELFKAQWWFFKARIQFYKRFIQQKKEQKMNSIGNVNVDDIQSAE